MITGEEMQHILLGIIALGLLRIIFRAWAGWRSRQRQKKEWDAMGRQGSAPVRRSRGAFLFSALMVVVLGWFFLPQVTEIHGGEVSVYTVMTRWQWLLGALWLFFCLRCALLFVRGVWRFITKPRPRAVKPVKPVAVSPVALMVPCPGASSSRAAMEKQLPGYAAALLTRNRQAEQQRVASGQRAARA